jgi:hypothetical protein
VLKMPESAARWKGKDTEGSAGLLAMTAVLTVRSSEADAALRRRREGTQAVMLMGKEVVE